MNWPTKPAKRLFVEVDERGNPELPRYAVTIDRGMIPASAVGDREAWTYSDAGAYKTARVGDIAYNKMRAWQGAFGWAPEDCLVSPDYVVLRPLIGVDSRFYSMLFGAPPMTSMFYVMGRGIHDDRNRLYWRDFGQHRLLHPPIDEQRRIADFLDRETARIDELVRAKSRQVERLREAHDAWRSAALSPAGWDGDLPQGWAWAPLMRLVDSRRPIMYGIVLPGPNVEDGVMIVKSGDVKPGKLRPNLLHRTTREIEASYARARLCGGDIVIAIRGSVGNVEIVPPDIEGANLTQDAARVAPASGVSVTWLLEALRTHPVREQISLESTGATVKGINIKELKRLRIQVPPEAERQSLGLRCRERWASVETACNLLTESLSTLAEYRRSLITEAVTGQLDPRRMSDAASEERLAEVVA